MLLAGYACWRSRKHPGAARLLWVLSLAALSALSMPLVSRALLGSIEPVAADPLRAAPAQAIVVLGGGRYGDAPEYASDTVNEATLTRLRYAAWLQRRTGKPVLVTGGSPEGRAIAEATLMKAVLENEFGTPVAFTESASRNTLENARASRTLLAPLGIHRVYLVTHAWHMRRAHSVFTQAGFDVVPAPTMFSGHARPLLMDLMPDADALRDSSDFFHELLGLLWYRLKSVIA